MESFGSTKLFSANLTKIIEDPPEISPIKKEKTKKSPDDPEESPFSFSFSNFAPSDYRKTKEPRKVQFGLNLLISFQKSLKAHSFALLKSSKSRFSPLDNLFNFFASKKKRAYFIRWYVQSIKISSESKVSVAMTTVSKLNTYSRKFISCSILYFLFNKHYTAISQKFFFCLPLVTSSKFLDSYNTSLISSKARDRWLYSGLFKLHDFFLQRSLSLKRLSLQVLNSDISLQRRAFIDSTDRCIALSEQLFEAKEEKEKAEFEKEELAAVLESKTDELNKLMDVIEEYKSWQGKLNSMEKAMNEEIGYWKNQANKYQNELEKKNKEIIEVYSDKKKAEEECLKAYRNLDLAQRQNLEIHKEGAQDSPQKDCKLCESLKNEIQTYEELMEEFKKSEEKHLAQIRELQENASRPSSVVSQKSKTKPLKSIPKKSLEFERTPISDTENQFAMEVVSLNKQLNKVKHELKMQGELLKKIQHERDELKKIMVGKDEALLRLRKDNDQLSISLSTDHYKSIHKLEYSSSQIEQQNKELLAELASKEKAREEVHKRLESLSVENEELKIQVKDLQALQKSADSEKISENLKNMQSRFLRLKEMSDRQIQNNESLKQENFQLMQNIESFKAIARSSKLHADKAIADSDAYASVIKRIENQLAQTISAKENAEAEVALLKQHLMKLLNSR